MKLSIKILAVLFISLIPVVLFYFPLILRGLLDTKKTYSLKYLNYYHP